MSLTDNHTHTADHLPRPHGRDAAEACWVWLANPTDARILVDATLPTATTEQTKQALGTVAVNHNDLPPDLQMRLLAHYCGHLAEAARFGLFRVLCEQADEMYGLVHVDGYVDQFREEGEPRPDARAMLATAEFGFDETLRLLTVRS